MVKKLLILIACFIAMGFNVMAQNVSGKVTQTDGSGIPGVTVAVKGASGATMTNAEGNYSIGAGANATLVFSAVGFTSREVAVQGRSVVNVELEEDNTLLQEVVVTALGIQREKKSLGFAVQELKGSDIVEARESNLANAFTGKVAGLQVVRSSRGAGGSSKIVLRGNTSLTGSNQPLIVVDGIPIDNFTGGSGDYWNASFDYGNGLGDINPEDIQSLSVLKGPSAAALYGSRAGNGVILITTKSGRKQPGLGISFTSTLGSENVFMWPELQTTFAQGDNNIFNPISNNSWGPKMEGQSVAKWDGSQQRLTGAPDNVNSFLKTGTTQNYGLALQQQYGTTGIYTSVNYLEDQSIIPGNKLQRLNFSSKATTSFGPQNRWTSDVKVSYNNTAGYNRPINGRDRSNLYSLYTMPRSMDIEDFSAGVDANGNMLWYPGAYGWVPNPYWSVDRDLNQDKRNRFMMTGALKYAFTDWLDVEVRAGGDLFSTNKERKSYAGGPLANQYVTSKESFTEVNYTALLKAVKDNVIGKFGGNFTLGGNLMDRNWSLLGVSTTLEVPNLFSPSNSVGTPGISNGVERKKINSVFASAGVNYGGWIYLDVTARNDWSSAMTEANRSYFYPSYSLSYVLSDHLSAAGTNLPSWLTYTKLRASYATVGNDLAPYQLYNGYSVGTDQVGSTVASRDRLLKDPNVRSELIKNLEFGTELKFLQNRLSLDFTWYKSNATRQLIDLPLDPMSGFERMKINAGNIQNKGFEIMATANILTNPDKLGWSVMANFSRNENKIIDIASDKGVNFYNLPGGTFDDLFIRATTDGFYGDIYGTKFLRVKDQSSPHFGKIILNGDGIPQRDPEITKLGNQQAKGLIGVTNTFNYKSFGFQFLVDARLGGEIFSGSNVGMQRFGVAAVTAPNGERPDLVVDGVVGTSEAGYTQNTKAINQQQYWLAVGTLGNLGIGEANIYDATNVRLRNVTLSYSLPKKMLGNVFQSAKASLACNNVWMIKSYLPGVDPESVFATGSNAVGFESGAYPTMRSYLVSLSFGF